MYVLKFKIFIFFIDLFNACPALGSSRLALVALLMDFWELFVDLMGLSLDLSDAIAGRNNVRQFWTNQMAEWTGAPPENPAT